MKKTSYALIAFLVLLSACGKQDQFLYVSNLNQSKTHQYSVKEIVGASQVDVLWVIDNSGSMDDEQRTIRDSVQSFMKVFTTKKINWKMGLISTDTSDGPYIGFESNDLLDWQSADSINRFKNAVGRLGTNGSGTERAFDPMIKHLTQYPKFLRPNTPLATIMVTDENEQSKSTAKELHDFLTQTMKRQEIFAFGVFAANDIPGCASNNGWSFGNDPYGEFLSLVTRSKAFSLCQSDFGPDLDQIFDTISQLVSTHNLLLPEQPIPSTIKVLFDGTLLKGGAKEDGAVWYYNYDLNAISFYTLDFAPDGTTEKVTVEYEKEN